MTNTTTALYLRYSVKDETGNIQDQSTLCRNWLRDNGFDPNDCVEYVDDGQSAYKKAASERPGWQRLEQAIKRGTVTRVVTRGSDRLSRRVTDTSALIQLVEDYGVQVVAVWNGGQLDFSNPYGRHQAIADANTAETESRIKSQRVSNAKARARLDGRASGGGRPFGYESINGGLRDDEAALVRQGIEHVLSGGTLKGATEIFRSSGVKSIRGKSWEHAAVKTILMRWRNAGHLEHKGQDAGKAVYPAIVDIDTLKAVRAALAPADRQQPNRKAAGPYASTLLSGIIICDPCNVTMRGGGNIARGKSVDNRRGTYACPNCGTQVMRDTTDDQARAAMGRFWARTKLEDVAPSEDLKKEIQALQSQRSALDEESDDATAMFTDGLISTKQLRNMQEAIKKKRDRLEHDLEDLQSRYVLASSLSATAATGLFGEALAALEHFNGLPLDIQRRQIEEVWEIRLRTRKEAEAQLFNVNGVDYKESLTRTRVSQRRALYRCLIAEALSFDPVAEDLADAQSAAFESLEDPDHA